MSSDLIDEIVLQSGVQKRALIEKDMKIHGILRHLSADSWFCESFLFKGGTCLIKGYLGYYRFSEDIDFTYKAQSEFNGLSGKKVRGLLSGIINRLGGLFEVIADLEGLEFECDKSNRDFVELGGSNRFCTFKLWYGEGFSRSFIKAQFNFVEILCFKPRRVGLSTFMKVSDDLVGVYPEAAQYFEPVSLLVYDPREILCEKMRAILTRRGIKARDFVDIYMLKMKLGLDVEDEFDCTEEKVSFMLEHYARYRENIGEKRQLLESEGVFDWGNEEDLLLVEIDQSEFYRYVEHIEGVLKKLSRFY